MKHICLMLFSFLLITSCADDELGPILTFDKAEIGSYIRLVQLNSGEFDRENPTTTALDYQVDFVDGEAGAASDKYTIEVSFSDNTRDNGNNTITERKLLRVVDKADFITSAKGNKGVNVNITLTETLAALGLTLDDVTAGDRFNFFTSIAKGDKVFSSNNSTATVRGSAFQGYFDFGGKFTCPQPNDKFVGDYTISFEGGSSNIPWGSYEAGTVVTVESIPGSTTKRRFSSLILPAIGGYGPYTSIFDLVCDKAEFEIMDSDGLGCGNGGILFGPVVDDNGIPVGAPIDLNDDSVIKLLVNEAFANGGCAALGGGTETTIILTKM